MSDPVPKPKRSMDVDPRNRMAKQPHRPRLSRRLRVQRRRLIGAAFTAGGLAALIVAAPTIINAGFARRSILQAMQRRAPADAVLDFDQIAVSWSGPQIVLGLRVRDPWDVEVANLDVGADIGLIPLVFGAVDGLVVNVTGRVRGELYADGTTSLSAWRSTPASGEEAAAPSPVELAGMPSVVVNVLDLALVLADEVRQQEIVIRGVAGEVRYDAPGDLSIDLANTDSSEPGPIVTWSGAIHDLAGEAGTLDASGLNGETILSIHDITMPGTTHDITLTSLRLVAESPGLADLATVWMHAETAVAGESAGTLDVNLAMKQPLDATGGWDLSVDRITGTVTGEGVASGILQPLLARTPIEATRDLGPTVDLAAHFTGEDGERVEIRAKSEQVEMEFTGTVDTKKRIVTGEHLVVLATVAPVLLAEVAALEGDEGIPLRLEVDRFVLPADLARLTFSGRVLLDRAVALRISGGHDLPLDSIRLEVDADPLEEGLAIRGVASAAGAEAKIDLTLGSLLDAGKSPWYQTIVPHGTVNLRGVPRSLVMSWFPGDIRAGDQGAPLDITARATAAGNDVGVTVYALSEGLDARVTAHRTPTAIHFDQSILRVRVSRELAKGVQRDAAEMVPVLEPIDIFVEANPFTLTFAGDRENDDPVDEPSSPGPPVTIDAKVSVPSVVLGKWGPLNAGITMNRVLFDGTATLGETLRIEGAFAGHLLSASQPLGTFRGSLDGSIDGAGTLVVAHSALEVGDLQTARVEGLLGSRSHSIQRWVGGRFSVALDVDWTQEPIRLTVTPESRRLGGAYHIAFDPIGDRLAITTERTTFTIPHELIQARLRPDERTGLTGMVEVSEDLRVQLNLRRLEMPASVLRGEAVVIGDVRLDATVTGGPLVLRSAASVATRLDRLVCDVRIDDAASGFVSLRGEVKHPDGTPGTLLAEGTIENFGPDATLDLQVEARAVPSAAIDALGRWEGLLVAAFGDSFDAEIDATDLSGRGGALRGYVHTPNGIFRGAARGGDLALLVDGAAAVEAEFELTEPLRKRLLERIHPLLADIRSEQRVRATLTNARLPLDGSARRLNADIEIKVGAVQFDSGSITLALLKVFNATHAGTIPGSIEPVIARIRNGVLTYDRFAVHIDKHTLVYEGKIDFNSRIVDLRTEVPLSALALSVKKLHYADDVVVPLVTRGTFGNVKTEIDPEFDLVKAGIESAADDLISEGLKSIGDKNDFPIKGILDGLFGGK